MASPGPAAVPSVVVTAASPVAGSEQSNMAVAPPPPAAQQDHYGKQPRDDGGAPATQQQQQQQQPPPMMMMGYGYPAIALHCLGPQPAVVDCPFCGNRVQTQVEDHDSHMTILSGIGLGFLCPCVACLPCCLGWFQDVDHYCPCCQQRVAHVPYNLPAQVILPAPGTAMVPPPPQQQQQQYAPGHGYPPAQAPQPQAPPQLARYA